MLKTFRLWKRGDGVSAEEFKWRWLTEHAAAQREAVRFAPIERVTASFHWPRQIQSYAPGHQVAIPTDFDGVESLHFRSVADLKETLDGGVLRVLERHLRAFAEPHDEVPWAVTLEEIMGDAPDTHDHRTGVGDLKLFRILSRKEGMARLAFRMYWHNNHRILEAAAPFTNHPGSKPGQRHLRTSVCFNTGQVIVDHTVRAADDFESPNSIDCTNEHWYTSNSEPWEFYETVPFPDEVRQDELNFINFEAPVRRSLMGEYVIAARSNLA